MQISERRVLVKAIKDIIESIDYSFNAVEITKLINKKHQSDYSWTLVRNLMKTDLNLSFKRVQPRPNSINLNRVKAIRQLFILKFLNEITTDYLIINIDETSINRHIRTNYSWCLKGTSKEVVNSPFLGSLSMISSICTNGNWISFIVNNTIDWQKFMTYLDHLYKWLKANKNFGFKNIAIILDNWSIHKTQKVKIKLNKMFSKTIYLPPYSPQFAPIEMFFGIFKRNLRSKFNSNHVKLKSKDSLSLIIQSLKTIKSSTIKKLFGIMYSSIKSCL